MPITTGQREQRKLYLGSSDSAAIVGLNKWKSAGDVFIEKTQDLPERDMGEAALIGTLCEDACLQWFAPYQNSALPYRRQISGRYSQQGKESG